MMHVYYPHVGRYHKNDKLTMQQVLEKYSCEINHVCLIWAWDQEYYTEDFFNGSMITHVIVDPEYSYVGDRQGALEHVRQSSHWDFSDFIIIGDLLFYRYVQKDLESYINLDCPCEYERHVRLTDIEDLLLYKRDCENRMYWVDPKAISLDPSDHYSVITEN